MLVQRPSLAYPSSTPKNGINPTGHTSPPSPASQLKSLKGQKHDINASRTGVIMPVVTLLGPCAIKMHLHEVVNALSPVATTHTRQIGYPSASTSILDLIPPQDTNGQHFAIRHWGRVGQLYCCFEEKRILSLPVCFKSGSPRIHRKTDIQ